MGGVGGREGGTKDERPRTGQGRSEAYDLDARWKPDHVPLEDEIPDADPLREGSSEAPAPRPATLALRSVPPPGRLLDALRKDSPVEALQRDYLRRAETEGGGRLVGGLPGAAGERSAPLSPSAGSQSSAEPDWSETGHDALSDVSENSPQSERLLAAGAPRHPRAGLNDLSLGHQWSSPQGEASAPRPGLVFAPNIDASPESNLTDETKSFPREEDPHSPPADLPFLKKERESCFVTPRADVTASSARSANEECPEIPSDDAMGCERPLAPSARVPLAGAKRFSRPNKPRDLRLHEERGCDADRGREAGVAMGGLFSRGSSAPSRPNQESPSDVPTSAARSPSSGCPPASPSMRRVKQPLHQDKPATPSYVRTRADAQKRQTGFGHVHSDNVRRMRDVWGAKQDPKTQVPLRPHKECSSPTKSTSRRSSDDWRSPRTSECESPRPHSVPSSERNNFSFRNSSPSPSRRTSSTISSSKPSSDSSTARVNGSYTVKPPSSPHWDASKRSGQASHRKGSPVPPSPSSKYSKDSPLASPSVERRQKEDSGRRFSYDKVRRDSSKSSDTPPPKDRRSPPSEESPRSSKVHHKIFKRLRDANLQPDSEAICFKEEENRYKVRKGLF